MWKISDGRLDYLVVFSCAAGPARPVGALTFEGVGRKRSSFFRYARSWLAAGGDGIDPVHLPRGRGAKRAPEGVEVPFPFLDAGPDGWGRAILAHAFPEQYFGAAEYLAATGDERAGELGFGPDAERPERWIPSRGTGPGPGGETSLAELQDAAASIEEGRPTRADLALLFRASADTGGARPKAAIRRDGVDWIAKFRALDDAWDEPRVEACTLDLAEACGIEVSPREIVEVGGRAVLLVRRFDRIGDRRLGYTSAATLLSAHDLYSTSHSYAGLAARARETGIHPCEEELFRRMLFNCFVRNTDDHLRNHGFIRTDGRWRLSPAFDLTANRPRNLVLRPAPGISAAADPNGAFAAHPAFGLSRPRAAAIHEEIVAGLERLDEILDRRGIASRDRRTLREGVWTTVWHPPPLSGSVAGVRP